MLIESFHSGPRGRRRYCSLHRPSTRLVKSTGVVLCHPLGHEYYRAYRACVKLAQNLSDVGFPVLRFDYVGTGDSEGDGGHARLDDWLVDIANSADDLRKSENVSGLVLGGVRFGATLAHLAAQRIDEVEAVLLWDPVEDGAGYVAELQSLHAEMLADLERFRQPRSPKECIPTEFVGATFARGFLEDVASVRLDYDQSPPTDAPTTIRAMSSRGTTATRQPSGGKLEHIDCRADYGWHDRQRLEESMVDPATINTLVASLNRAVA